MTVVSDSFVGREWALDRVDAWLAGDEPSLLIFGAPGVGKTALAARIRAISQGGVPADGRVRLGRGAITYAHFCRALDPPAVDPLVFLDALSDLLGRLSPAFAAARAEFRGLRAQITGTATTGRWRRVPPWPVW
jgi:hypothetical protein